jgi:L-malate glycosyltransferase
VSHRLNSTGDGGGDASRILVVSPWESLWSLGGGDVAAGVSDDDHFIEGFTRAGYRIDFLRPASAQRDARVGNHTYPNFFAATRGLPVALKRMLWPALFNAIVAPRALSLARSLRVDLVLGHSHYATFTTWVCRRRLGVPVAVKLFGVMDLVHTEWSPVRYGFKNVEQLIALRFPQDAWIVLDDGTRGDEILRARGIPGERVHFLANGVDLSWTDVRVERGAARARFDLPRDGHVVLFLARLVASKRPLDLIRAAATLGAPPLVVFAGDGDLRAACERAARETGLSGRVRFLGAVPHAEIPTLMAAADLFVSTSSLTNRALPTCEAMMGGAPVIVYDTGDTTAVVRDGENGVVVPDGDVRALAAAIERLLADAPLRARLADRARRFARETFVSWEARVADEVRIVEGMIASVQKKTAGPGGPAVE